MRRWRFEGRRRVADNCSKGQAPSIEEDSSIALQSNGAISIYQASEPYANSEWGSFRCCYLVSLNVESITIFLQYGAILVCLKVRPHYSYIVATCMHPRRD